MELFGIVVAVSAGLILAPVFCISLLACWRLPRLRRAVRPGSWILLVLAAAELLLVASLGALHVREMLGPYFFWAHSVVAMAAAPALSVAIMFLESKPGFLRTFIASVASYCVGVGAIFFHIAVSESLFGIDGVNGPYKFLY